MGYFPFQGLSTHQQELEELIKRGAEKVLTDLKLLNKEVNKFKNSEQLKWAKIGEDYYKGNHDILNTHRKAIGEGGRLRNIENIPNNKIIDNDYANLVDQKVNYQLGKPILFTGDNREYIQKVKKILNKKFTRTFRTIGYDVFNGGYGWLYPYIDNNELKFKTFSPTEIIPYWKDADKTELDFAVRVYKELAYEGDKEVVIDKVDVMTVDGVLTYVERNGQLIADIESLPQAYITSINGDNVQYLNWERVPLIPFKFNTFGIPLIKRVKSLQDAINSIVSTFMNNMQEDSRNTILILHNVDGQDLGEFRANLATYGAIKVRSTDQAKGGVEALNIEVNSENYKVILDILKKAIISNGRGYSTKEDSLGANPNQMNLKFMYSDIELDANGLEVEFQAAFEELLWFVNVFLRNTGQGDYTNEEIEVVFNRDTLINESEVVDILNKSGFLSNKTKIEQHPYINDVEEEEARLKEQAENDPLFNIYQETLPNN